jgi:ribosomal protein S1
MSAGWPERGTVVHGTVSGIHNFGVFVRLEGDPADDPGTGFIRIPELAWEHFDDPAAVLHVGQRLSTEVLDYDVARGQVQLSLRALRPDPLAEFAGRVGQEVSGPVVKVVPFGVFVRVAPGIEGLLHESVLTWQPAVGETVAVVITEVDPPRRRVLLQPSPVR